MPMTSSMRRPTICEGQVDIASQASMSAEHVSMRLLERHSLHMPTMAHGDRLPR